MCASDLSLVDAIQIIALYDGAGDDYDGRPDYAWAVADLRANLYPEDIENRGGDVLTRVYDAMDAVLAANDDEIHDALAELEATGAADEPPDEKRDRLVHRDEWDDYDD